MHLGLNRSYTFALLAALLLGASTPASAGDAKHATICQLCGMDAAKSETEFILHLKEKPDMHACCINCARRIMNKLGPEVTSVTTLDFRTRKHVPAPDALYLKGGQLIPKGSMMPFILAFGTREDAETFKAKYGGDICTFGDVVDELNNKKRGAETNSVPVQPLPGT